MAEELKLAQALLDVISYIKTKSQMTCQYVKWSEGRETEVGAAL